MASYDVKMNFFSRSIEVWEDICMGKAQELSEELDCDVLLEYDGGEYAHPYITIDKIKIKGQCTVDKKEGAIGHAYGWGVALGPWDNREIDIGTTEDLKALLTNKVDFISHVAAYKKAADALRKLATSLRKEQEDA